MIASVTEVVESVRTLLAGFQGIDGAFVYGSVARGTAGPASDVDLFVVTEGAPEWADRLSGAADTLQRRLGYRPDPSHPVEVFPAAHCADALTGPLVACVLRSAAEGQQVDGELLDSDDLEILRALLDQRVAVRASPLVDGLTALARYQVSAAGRLDVPIDRVLGVIGLTVKPAVLRGALP